MFGILCFGDSITFGRGNTDRKGWSGRLRDYFSTKEGYNEVYNLGIPGDNSNDLLFRFETECKARVSYIRPGDNFIILIGIGINDSRFNGYEKIPEVDIDTFSKNIDKLIELSKKYTKQVVFVGLTPVNESITKNYEGTIFTNDRISEYDHIVKTACIENNLLFVDVHNQMKKLDYPKLLDDGLHPNSDGYEEIYKIIKEFLIKNKLID